MKSKYVILASALMISVATFAQKDQIKAAEKALKGGNSQEALTILQGAEAASTSAPDNERAQFSFVKANALLDLANKNIETGKNLSGFISGDLQKQVKSFEIVAPHLTELLMRNL